MRKLLVAVMTVGLILVPAAPGSGAPPCGLSQVAQWSEWGSPGDQYPLGGTIDAAVDHRGDVYVSGEGDGQIHVFTGDGEYLRSFEAEGPHGVAVDQERVYNAAWGPGKVQVFDKAGTFLFEWSEWFEDGALMSFGYPLFIDVDSQGFIYVTDMLDPEAGLIGLPRKFTPTGEWVMTFPDPANAVAVHGARVYLTNPAGSVDVYTTKGSFITSFGSFGDGDGQFEDPRGIAVAGGSVYVNDTNSKRIQAFSLNGTFRSVVTVDPPPDPGDPELTRLDGVGASPKGNVYAADQFQNLITWLKDGRGRGCS